MKLDESYCSRYARTQATRANSFPSLLGLLTKNKALYWAKSKVPFLAKLHKSTYIMAEIVEAYAFLENRGCC